MNKTRGVTILELAYSSFTREVLVKTSGARYFKHF